MLLILSLTISVASANDLDNITLNDINTDIVLEDASQENMQTEMKFCDIQTKIDNATQGDTIKVNGEYVSNSKEDILIVDKSISLIGDNATLNANKISRIMNITADNVVIKNIKFINGYSDMYAGVYVFGNNCSIIDCEFINNNAYGNTNLGYSNYEYWGRGGALTVYGDNCSVVSSKFEKNFASAYGATIDVYGKKCTIEFCNFTNNEVRESYVLCGEDDTIINYCNLTQNLADSQYGLHECLKVGIVLNSYFADNHATHGLLNSKYIDNSTFLRAYRMWIHGPIYNSLFNNSGGIYITNEESVIVDNCSFINGTFYQTIYIENSNCSFENCNFINNKVVDRNPGHIFSSNNSNVTILNSVFINNTSDDYALIFNNGTVNIIDCFIENTTIAPPTLAKKSVKVLTSTLTTYYNSGKYPTITLKDSNNQPIIDEYIFVEIHDKTLKIKTDKKGQAKITTALVPKTYDTKITFNGNDLYVNATENVKVVIKKATPKLSISNKKFKLKSTKKLTATLKDNKGKILKNKNIIFKVKNKTYKTKTNSKGKATVTIKLTKKGTVKYTSTFKGDDKFLKVSKTGKITVK